MNKPLLLSNPKSAVEEFSRLIFLFPIFVNYVFSLLFKVLSIDSTPLPNLVFLFFIICSIMYILLSRNKRSVKSLIVAACLLFLSAISLLVYKDLFTFASHDVLSFFIISLPCIILFSDPITSNTKRMFNFLCALSGSFFVVIYSIHSFFTPILNSLDYQTVSYSLIIPIICIIQKSKKNIFDIALILLMLFFCVFIGGRGPLVCVAIFIVHYVLLSKKVGVCIKVSLIILSVVVIKYAEPILIFIINKTNEIGLNSSFSIYYNYGDIFSDSGRWQIYKYAVELAQTNWLTGAGIFSDRILLQEIGKTYPHNMFLEFLIHFGYPVTFAISCWFVIKSSIVLFFKKIPFDKKTIFTSLFFSMGFLILMFSSSYLIQPHFFALIGLLIGKKDYKKSDSL